MPNKFWFVFQPYNYKTNGPCARECIEVIKNAAERCLLERVIYWAKDESIFATAGKWWFVQSFRVSAMDLSDIGWSVHTIES